MNSQSRNENIKKFLRCLISAYININKKMDNKYPLYFVVHVDNEFGYWDSRLRRIKSGLREEKAHYGVYGTNNILKACREKGVVVTFQNNPTNLWSDEYGGEEMVKTLREASHYGCEIGIHVHTKYDVPLGNIFVFLNTPVSNVLSYNQYSTSDLATLYKTAKIYTYQRLGIMPISFGSGGHQHNNRTSYALADAEINIVSDCIPMHYIPNTATNWIGVPWYAQPWFLGSRYKDWMIDGETGVLEIPIASIPMISKNPSSVIRAAFKIEPKKTLKYYKKIFDDYHRLPRIYNPIICQAYTHNMEWVNEKGEMIESVHNDFVSLIEYVKSFSDNTIITTLSNAAQGSFWKPYSKQAWTNISGICPPNQNVPLQKWWWKANIHRLEVKPLIKTRILEQLQM